MGPVLGSHARTDRTRDRRVAEPRLPAPEDGRPGEGQRLTPGAPRNGGRPPPPGGLPPPPKHAAPTGYAGRADGAGPPHPRARAHSMWVADPTACPGGGRPGGEQRLAPDAPHNGGEPPPRGRPPPPPRSAAPPGHASRGGSAGPPQPHTRAHGKSGDGPTARPEGGQSGEGERLTTDGPRARGQRAPTAPRRRAAAGGRVPGLGRPSQRDRHGPRGGEHLVPIRTHECRPAEQAYELPHPRPAAPTARAPPTGSPHPTPCS